MVWARLNYLLVLLNPNHAGKIAPEHGDGPLPQSDTGKDDGIADVGEPSREQEYTALAQGHRDSENKDPGNVNQDAGATAFSLYLRPSSFHVRYDCTSQYFAHYQNKERGSEGIGCVIGREEVPCQFNLQRAAGQSSAS